MKQTQCDVVLSMVKRGWVTPMRAFDRGITCPAERIRDLRGMGFRIEDEWRNQNGKRFKAYRLAR